MGGSRYSTIISIIQYLAITGAVGFGAWTLHPWLVESISDVFKLDFKDSTVTPLQNSFFSELSLLFSIFSGNTMAFLYNRQKDLVAQFYEEISILEEVMEEAAYALGDEAFGILRQVRKYIDQEIRSEINQLPPFEDGLALSAIRSEARRFRDKGATVDGLMEATLKLAQSQNMRQAASLRALPFVHWALLYILGITFVLTLVLLEPGGSFSSEGRQLLFTVLSAMMAFVLMVISDLADPSEGVYSSASAMEERLEATDRMLERHQRLPIIPEPGTGQANAETNAYLNRRPAGVAVTKEDVDGSEVRGLASLTVRQPKLNPPKAPKLPKRPQLPDLYGSSPTTPGNIKPDIRWTGADASTQEESLPREPPRE